MTISRWTATMVAALVFVLLSAGSQASEENPLGATPGEDAPGVDAPEAEPDRVELEDPFKPRYIVESIEVRGNDKTQGDLIISQLLLQPGETLDEDKVQLSRIRLLAMGYFRDVRMSLEKGSERGRVKLVVDVEERNTIIIDDLFGGYSDTNPFWAGAGVSDINFLGRGLVLSGAVVASEHQQAYRLGMFWPSVFNTRFQAGFQALLSFGDERAVGVEPCDPATCEDRCNSLGENDHHLEYLRAGGILSTGMRVDREHRISLELHMEHIESVDLPGADCPNNPFEGYIRTDSFQSTYSSLTFRFERDTRDDFFLPTSGMHLVISVELASKVLGSDYEFSKYLFKYEHSFPAFLDHAFRFTVVGGLIQDIEDPRGAPFFSRFFVGDYAFFQIEKDSLPRNLELNFSEVVDYGDLLASITVEYDIPVWSTGTFFYRGYAYAALNFSYVTKAAFLKTSEEWSGRTKRPVSMDLGFKVDTPVGLFTLTLGYWFDVIF